MLQALLVERFKLKVHHETKILPVYVLLVGKNGPKMQNAESDEGQPGIGFGNPLEARKISMAFFSSMLSGYMDRPVLDQTELVGSYNFKLNVAVQELVMMKMRTQTPDSGVLPSIFEGVEQIGLKLEGRKAPIEMLIVDSVEKVPTEN